MKSAVKPTLNLKKLMVTFMLFPLLLVPASAPGFELLEKLTSSAGQLLLGDPWERKTNENLSPDPEINEKRRLHLKEALDQIDRWLTAVYQASSDGTIEDKLHSPDAFGSLAKDKDNLSSYRMVLITEIKESMKPLRFLFPLSNETFSFCDRTDPETDQMYLTYRNTRDRDDVRIGICPDAFDSLDNASLAKLLLIEVIRGLEPLRETRCNALEVVNDVRPQPIKPDNYNLNCQANDGSSVKYLSLGQENTTPVGAQGGLVIVPKSIEALVSHPQENSTERPLNFFEIRTKQIVGSKALFLAKDKLYSLFQNKDDQLDDASLGLIENARRFAGQVEFYYADVAPGELQRQQEQAREHGLNYAPYIPDFSFCHADREELGFPIGQPKLYDTWSLAVCHHFFQSIYKETPEGLQLSYEPGAQHLVYTFLKLAGMEHKQATTLAYSQNK